MFKWLAVLVAFVLPVSAAAEAPPPASNQFVGRAHECAAYYPEAAVRNGTEGTTEIGFTITTDGSVRDVTVTKSSGNDDLDAAAVQCASRWRYRSARRDGVPIESPWKASVVWKLHTRAEYQLMQICARYHPLTADTFRGIGGVTEMTFRLMPDGKAKDISVTKSSGDKSLDDAAIRCLSETQTDTTRLTIPADGAELPAVVNWRTEFEKLAQAGAPVPPDVTPPALISRTPCVRRSSAVYLEPYLKPTSLQFLIATDGSVQQAKVVHSSGDAALDDAAISCVAKWRYRAAQKNGVPFAVPWRTEIDWRMH